MLGGCPQIGGRWDFEVPFTIAVRILHTIGQYILTTYTFFIMALKLDNC